MASRISISYAARIAAFFIIAAFALATPRLAYASTADAQETPSSASATSETSSTLLDGSSAFEAIKARIAEHCDSTLTAIAEQKANRVLTYDRALIDAIGNQTADGHMICCPAYACAYGDAVISGVANSHTYYGCGCCTWPNWGGGNSSFRSLGSNEALLREAYNEISAGRPTVIHVSGTFGEHWICLIGYQNAADPDNLTLDNFIALDPVYGNEIVASDGYTLYGDACEHISDAR